MAIYHCSVKVIGRSSGRSSVGASAYRSGEKLYNERDGLTHDYTRKSGIEYKEILTPNNAPSWTNDREKLWNEVEKVEKRKDSQLAREIEVAFPKKLSQNARIELIKDYAKENFVDKGMIADIAIHDKGNENPHAHIMVTTRNINEDGFGKKEREWNKKEYLEKWRESWSICTNKYLEKEGHKERIDHRSYKEQGIEKIPMIHMGVKAAAMEKRGIETEKGNINREIINQNKQLQEVKKQIEGYNKEILDLEQSKKQEVQEQKIDINKVKDNYVEVVVMNENLRTKHSNINNEIRKNDSNIKDIDKIKIELNRYEKEIHHLKNQYESTSFLRFNKRKEISNEIDSLELRQNNIYSLLKNKYGIEGKEQIEKAINKLKNTNKDYIEKVEDVKKGIEKTQNLSELYERDYKLGIAQIKIEKYKVENDIVEPENGAYSNENNLARREDRLESKDALETKIKPIDEQNMIRESLQNKLNTIRVSQRLDNKITLKDIEKIADKLTQQDKDILLKIIKRDSTEKDQEKIREINLER